MQSLAFRFRQDLRELRELRLGRARSNGWWELGLVKTLDPLERLLSERMLGLLGRRLEDTHACSLDGRLSPASGRGSQ